MKHVGRIVYSKIIFALKFNLTELSTIYHIIVPVLLSIYDIFAVFLLSFDITDFAFNVPVTAVLWHCALPCHSLHDRPTVPNVGFLMW